jgi:hypothetical protein
LDHLLTPRAGRMAVVTGNDGDVIVCTSEKDVYETVGGVICSGSDGGW